jgi:histidinol-phosphate/aromatic aminotransferase/cobyric acid decarboxylase-like protein
LNRKRFVLFLCFGLAGARCGHVVGNGLIFVEANVAGIGTHESFVEDAAGQLLKLLFFQSAEQTRSNLGGERDIVERDATLLPLFFQTIAEGSHLRRQLLKRASA